VPPPPRLQTKDDVIAHKIGPSHLVSPWGMFREGLMYKLDSGHAQVFCTRKEFVQNKQQTRF